MRMISRRRLSLSYTIQQVISNICTKFQSPRFSSSWEIFDEKKNLHTNIHTHTHTHTHTHCYWKDKNYIPSIYFVYRGYNNIKPECNLNTNGGMDERKTENYIPRSYRGSNHFMTKSLWKICGWTGVRTHNPWITNPTHSWARQNEWGTADLNSENENWVSHCAPLLITREIEHWSESMAKG